MTPEQYRENIAKIEAWANLEAAKYRPILFDDHPGCGEPGHVYNTVKWMQYEQRYASQLAAIQLAMEHLSECVEARFYGVALPLLDGDSREVSEAARALIAASGLNLEGIL